MDCDTPGFPVLRHSPEFAQSHVHWVSDATQPSHPLSSASPPTLNLPQHQGLFQWVSSLHQVGKGVSASITVLPVNIHRWSTCTLTKFWVGESKVEFGGSHITLVNTPCLFLLMSLEAESRNLERTDTLTHSWSGNGLRVAHATLEFQSPLIYLVECGNKIRETTMAGGTVWLLNAEGVIILSVCVSSYQKLTLRVGWGWDLHFLFIFYWDLLFFTEITPTLNCGTWFWDTPSLLHLYLLFPTTKAWEEVWSLGHRLKS